ncbi:MAG TPA: hypothetical protein VK983_03365 [Candidatus Limnocylindrales bacterium]|nr:hypothetical protein [Candidatus Limnocylindrales bacterium]
MAEYIVPLPDIVQPLIDPREAAMELYDTHLLVEENRHLEGADFKNPAIVELQTDYGLAEYLVGDFLHCYVSHPTYGLACEAENRVTGDMLQDLGGQMLHLSGISKSNLEAYRSSLAAERNCVYGQPDSVLLGKAQAVCDLLVERPWALQKDIVDTSSHDVRMRLADTFRLDGRGA